jgi:hypothetical protein
MSVDLIRRNVHPRVASRHVLTSRLNMDRPTNDRSSPCIVYRPVILANRCPDQVHHPEGGGTRGPSLMSGLFPNQATERMRRRSPMTTPIKERVPPRRMAPICFWYLGFPFRSSRTLWEDVPLCKPFLPWTLKPQLISSHSFSSHASGVPSTLEFSNLFSCSLRHL